MKIRIGIFFGGNSREREVSFAGGRTVYDNLNKSLFEAVPIFVDSFNNFVLLDWHFIYKGSIRDFYPPVDQLPDSPNEFQVYAESLGKPDRELQDRLIREIGKKVLPDQLNELIDFAFLCLHGPFGEDGRIQGLLEFYGIPYSGSGILSSAIGINKAIQKSLMHEAGFPGPANFSIRRSEWADPMTAGGIITKIRDEIGYPCVVKPANQGSSIGVTILSAEDPARLAEAIELAFFRQRISQEEWKGLDHDHKLAELRSLCDIREGIGMPVRCTAGTECTILYHPEDLLRFLDNRFASGTESVLLEGLDADTEVLVEQFIDGKEFSCIVIRNANGTPVALPPTEIRKGRELFDYRSKYLPGLSRKITPIELPDDQIRQIRKECERLFLQLHFGVYARIDGFMTQDGRVFLNDPNTTSGMMPSSFFFHQAAEIGLNPSQFLTYIIRTSLWERNHDLKEIVRTPALLKRMDAGLAGLRQLENAKTRVAVIMGGYSSERHISVESGRNVYEKLSSSDHYEPFPVFLTGDEQEHELWQIPVNLMLKDNADDIRHLVQHHKVHPVIREIMQECEGITSEYTDQRNVLHPRKISYHDLAEIADVVFIALHGRPGEDGEIQKRLEAVGLPYNGSGTDSSRITINKYETNELLMRNGFSVARHALADREEWKRDPEGFYRSIIQRFPFPFIAKPVDDGCSSAVKKIRNEDDLRAFSEMIFRVEEDLLAGPASVLQLKAKEEFPRKRQFLLEELVTRKDAAHFLEITGGLMTSLDDRGKRVYEVFEASEALSEGDVLSLEEKFLAGEGQNITPARYARDPKERNRISEIVKRELQKAAELLNVEGYARIDAFVRVFPNGKVEVIFIEVNSLPGMTPATCIFHQTALAGYKPYEFIDRILTYGIRRKHASVGI